MRNITALLSLFFLFGCNTSQHQKQTEAKTINIKNQDNTDQNKVLIDLSGQQLSQIPESIFTHKDLTHLYLGSKKVTFFPPLSALEDGNSNELSFLPEKIGVLTNLRVLILNTNKLTSLPNGITKLENLEVLDLSLNKELDIVQELDKLRQLPRLKVLKIVDVKLAKENIDLAKSAFSPETKIIFTIKEYLEEN